jgi:putative SOS response-associated peptidase YedK
MAWMSAGLRISARATTLRRAKSCPSFARTARQVNAHLISSSGVLSLIGAKTPRGGPKPINAKAETISKLPMFREAYAFRRCIVPVDGFFEWRAIKGARGKQPYAIAMKDGSPFGLAGLWENWRDPNTGEWERTFAVITVPSNELVGQIHDRMPAILKSETYDRWLSLELDPHELLISYPSEVMTMWPISTRVNKPENDEPSILDRVGEPVDWQAPLGAADL